MNSLRRIINHPLTIWATMAVMGIFLAVVSLGIIGRWDTARTGSIVAIAVLDAIYASLLMATIAGAITFRRAEDPPHT